MEHLIDNFINSLNLLVSNFSRVAIIVGILWAIHFLNVLCKHRLNILGIYPRHIWGLLGIVFSPLLHKDFRHLFVNSIPLFILLSFVFLSGTKTAIQLTLAIVVLSGLGIWLFGRKGIHIGASALVMGYFGFILAVALHTLNPLALMVAAVCLFYLGGLFVSLFPTKEPTSWEGHLAGFIAGVCYAFCC